jgi:hypothetical protein
MADAAIHLDFSPGAQTVGVGDIVEIDLLATSDDLTSQALSGLDAILQWDTSYLAFIGIDDSNAGYAWFVSDFLPDPDGINTSVTDGQARYTALAQAGLPALATPTPGLLVTTLRFQALAETPATVLDFVPAVGAFGQTAVYDFDNPNQNVTGDISGIASVEIVPEPAAALLLLLGAGMAIRRRRNQRGTRRLLCK